MPLLFSYTKLVKVISFQAVVESTVLLLPPSIPKTDVAGWTVYIPEERPRAAPALTMRVPTSRSSSGE